MKDDRIEYCICCGRPIVYKVETPVDEMRKEEFDSRMTMGLAQAKVNQSAPVDEVFSRLIEEVQNG